MCQFFDYVFCQFDEGKHADFGQLYQASCLPCLTEQELCAPGYIRLKAWDSTNTTLHDFEYDLDNRKLHLLEGAFEYPNHSVVVNIPKETLQWQGKTIPLPTSYGERGSWRWFATATTVIIARGSSTWALLNKFTLAYEEELDLDWTSCFWLDLPRRDGVALEVKGVRGCVYVKEERGEVVLHEDEWVSIEPMKTVALFPGPNSLYRLCVPDLLQEFRDGSFHFRARLPCMNWVDVMWTPTAVDAPKQPWTKFYRHDRPTKREIARIIYEDLSYDDLSGPSKFVRDLFRQQDFGRLAYVCPDSRYGDSSHSIFTARHNVSAEERFQQKALQEAVNIIQEEMRVFLPKKRYVALPENRHVTIMSPQFSR